ncbi:hypothetical protein SYNTR_2050 [Candidatus Syntrophocurvum alkaliphilum]|uniref:MazG-like family protein n=1 Tax=Candidatus Syntrophocurvum alkaliphilum TaxID=2293317 RepID=A0A6I6DID6_9FIRM|nr:MazG-like family protein [Candidatus Syntrophocurvum alkaliphilum]QGU00644.1 hypothetical protein SYNTR_2050 [Candidatus Syntrophocurvum alkaliphilum]
MNAKSKEIDVAKNFKLIEWLKAELVESVAVFFKSLTTTKKEVTSDALATIIIITYLLGRRVGVSFDNIDTQLKNKLNTSIEDSHEVEEWYGDLSELLAYFENKKRW